MKKVELKDAKPYVAPKHFDMRALRLHNKEISGLEKFTVGLSHFLPGGGAEMAGGPTEKVYFVIQGEVTVQTPTEEITLRPWDSIYIGPDEQRAIINKTNMPASMLVIINT
jgi:quercetin dioxygenase-like cupin family protein